MNDLTIVRRSLTARRFSSVTTACTVGVAVALMLVLLMMRDSSRRAFERGSGDMHLLVSADVSPLVSVLDGIFYANPPRRPLAWPVVEKLSASLPIAPNGYAVPTQQGDSYMGQPVLATTREFFSKFNPNPGEPWKLAAGRFFEQEFEVVVGASAARATGLKLGAKIHLSHGTGRGPESDAPEGEHAGHEHGEFEYEVVGILEPTGGSHDRALVTDLTSTWIIHAHERREREDPGVTSTSAADLTDADRKVTGVYLRLATRPGSSAPANLPQVFDALRRDPSLVVASPSDEIRKLFVIVGNIDQIFIGLAAAVMVSSGIAIMLALYNSMEQRRRQIAVLRVLGCSRPRVAGLVVIESVLIGAAGTALGVALAVVGAGVVSGILRQRLGLVIDPALPLRPGAVVAGVSVGLAAIAGLVPALVAYRTPVAKNLRPLG